MLDFNRDVIEASHRQPVLVDFYATWCGPCKMLGPVLDEVVKATAGPLKLVAVNTDEHQDLAVASGVSGIPDVRLYVAGKQVECGIDIVNDGEQGRTDYTVHVLDRLTGFEGESSPPMGTGEPEFPELAEMLKMFASPFQYRPKCSGDIGWKDWQGGGRQDCLARSG